MSSSVAACDQMRDAVPLFSRIGLLIKLTVIRPVDVFEPGEVIFCNVIRGPTRRLLGVRIGDLVWIGYDDLMGTIHDHVLWTPSEAIHFDPDGDEMLGDFRRDIAA